MPRYSEELDKSDIVNHHHHDATAAQQLPILDRYGYQYNTSLSHPRVTAIRTEEGLDDIAFSSNRQDDIATSSPFTPLLQTWTYHRRDQPNTGPLGLSQTNILSMFGFNNTFFHDCSCIFLRLQQFQNSPQRGN